MYGDVLVGSWVDIHDGCPIRYEIGGSGVVFVYCGHDSSKAFQFSLESEALRELVRQGGEALREMDDMFANEQADAARALDMTAVGDQSLPTSKGLILAHCARRRP